MNNSGNSLCIRNNKPPIHQALTTNDKNNLAANNDQGANSNQDTNNNTGTERKPSIDNSQDGNDRGHCGHTLATIPQQIGYN